MSWLRTRPARPRSCPARAWTAPCTASGPPARPRREWSPVTRGTTAFAVAATATTTLASTSAGEVSRLEFRARLDQRRRRGPRRPLAPPSRSGGGRRYRRLRRRAASPASPREAPRRRRRFASGARRGRIAQRARSSSSSSPPGARRAAPHVRAPAITGRPSPRVAPARRRSAGASATSSLGCRRASDVADRRRTPRQPLRSSAILTGRKKPVVEGYLVPQGDSRRAAPPPSISSPTSRATRR